MKFHDVCPPYEPKSQTSEGHVSSGPYLNARLGYSHDNLLVQVRPLHGPDVVEPYLLDVDESRLPLAV